MTTGERKTILYVNAVADLYGGSRALLDLIARLDTARYRPLVLVPSDGPLVKHLNECNVVTVTLPQLAIVRRKILHWRTFARFAVSSIVSVWQIVALIFRYRVHLVHTNVGIIFAPAVAAAICGVPHVWHVREFMNERPKLWAIYSRLIVALSSRVICTSTATRRQFESLLVRYGDTIQVICDGLDSRKFQLSDVVAQRREGRQSNVIITIGRISVGKGQRVLMRAYARVHANHPDWQLVIVGDSFPGNELDSVALHKLANELGIYDFVRFTGFVEDVRSLLSRSQIFVLPSVIPEGFGLVALEAMAMGVPVIAPRLGGPLDIIEDGVSGILVPPGDDNALSDAIEKLVSDPLRRQSMSIAGRKRCLGSFPVEQTAALVQDLYRTILTQSSV
jgi:glycosyltransferase involved in cell wall biosynthesis